MDIEYEHCVHNNAVPLHRKSKTTTIWVTNTTITTKTTAHTTANMPAPMLRMLPGTPMM